MLWKGSAWIWCSFPTEWRASNVHCNVFERAGVSGLHMAFKYVEDNP